MKKTIITLICFLGIFTSCNDYLTRTPYVSISSDVAIIDARSADLALMGLYHLMQNSSAYGRDMLVIPDAATENNILSPSASRFVAISQWTVSHSTGESNNLWLQCYRIINAANEILKRVDNIKATDAERQAFKGEALAVRALMHFEMVRIYAQPYRGNESSMGIPYVLEPAIYDKPARDDVKTVYNNIISD